MPDLLSAGADDAPAISAPDRAPMNYRQLRELAAQTSDALVARGVGRDDAVAIVVPNGPEMASAFVAIASAATTAPLNPAYTAEEFDFYLSDLNARVLVVERGSQSPAITVAQERGIAVFELVVDPDAPAGAFTLDGDSVGTGLDAAPAGADDVALVLHTSGTTSRPKIVPLSQQNICTSARHIAESLALTPVDVCLNVMPLFHIHGLIAAVLSSLSAGAKISCTAGFNALHFFRHLETEQPTWYTAVPTMHQAILARAARNAGAAKAAGLRFVRSSSASLPPAVMASLETAFDAPVIEAYGMTEAAHQMASNPLPPRERKPGSVGLPAGPEVAIMDAAGQILAAGETGEVVIRGPNVTGGYLNNPDANAGAFASGWFRTGDQGVFDPQGYLRLTGRLKEIINRGGEKVSPREVDEVLLDHPAVAQAVTFAVPHDKLGEDIAAAVVLSDGAQATEADIRGYVRERLAAMKVPRQIVFMDEIPKGPTGKMQRIGLAARLGLA